MIVGKMKSGKSVEVVEKILIDFGYSIVRQVQRNQLLKFLDFIEPGDFVVRQIDRPRVVRKTEHLLIQPCERILTLLEFA